MPGARSRNFVLCPGKAYDRLMRIGTRSRLRVCSPTEKLKPGETWRQESIVGSYFDGSVSVENGEVRLTIRGSAFVNADSTLILNDADPFCWGIR